MTSQNTENVNSRKYLTQEELKLVFDNANGNYKVLFKLSYRHGLRCKEALDLTWENVDLNNGRLNVNRVKNGLSISHPLNGEELRYLKRHKRNAKKSPYVFPSRQSSRLTESAVRMYCRKLGKEIGLNNLHHHQFRHSCGYWMAMKGIPVEQIKDWLGHKNIINTMLYANLAGIKVNELRDWDN